MDGLVVTIELRIPLSVDYLVERLVLPAKERVHPSTHLVDNLVIVPVPLVDGLRVHLLPFQDVFGAQDHIPVVIVEP